jgi:ubiquinone/menaquinone biosynthesis C-methylase UbiE
VLSIDIPSRGYFLYLVLPHPIKMALLTPAARERLEAINRRVNEATYSGAAAEAYDARHRYEADLQHEYPARALVEEVWAPEGYGRVLELGAGSGYFTVRLARRAERVIAVEPVPDMLAVLRARCRDEGVANVEPLLASALEVPAHVPAGSVDTAVILQSLHHFSRRADVFAMLGRLVRPGGRLYLVEPHHTVRRAARLARAYLTDYRAPGFRGDERNWATHDFVTVGEVRRLARRGGFVDVRVSGYWVPGSRRVVPDARRRFALERRLGTLPGLRQLAGVVAFEMRRADRP